jgi:hypothetical protein
MQLHLAQKERTAGFDRTPATGGVEVEMKPGVQCYSLCQVDEDTSAKNIVQRALELYKWFVEVLDQV